MPRQLSRRRWLLVALGVADRKRRERAAAKDPADPFNDRVGYVRYIDDAEKRFRGVLAKEQRRR